MIFVTVGTQLPFPRLLDAMNDLAPDLPQPVIAQCGQREPRWTNIECHDTLTPDAFKTFTNTAALMVSHAGIGSILTAKSLGLPLIILPRRHEFGEHRNDHQLATARYVQSLQGVHVAWTADELGPLLAAGNLEPATNTPGPSYQTLVHRLRGFIETGE